MSIFVVDSGDAPALKTRHVKGEALSIFIVDNGDASALRTTSPTQPVPAKIPSPYLGLYRPAAPVQRT